MKESFSLDFQKEQLKEECPRCGTSLIESLQNRKVSAASTEQLQVSVTHTMPKPTMHPSTDFQTAYRQVEDSSVKFSFDLRQIDSLLNLDSKGGLCIIGDQKYTRLLIDRLCVFSMLPKRHGGIGEGYSKIIVIDAGNCSDVYQIVNFARQYGLEVRKVLRNMLVSRVFTIYQLAHFIIHELPRVIERLSSESQCRLIVVYGLLHLFVSDPHIDKADAKQLIKEIADSIKKISEDRFVVVSAAHCKREYEKPLFPVFDNVIRTVIDIENGKVLRLDVNTRNHITGGKGFRSIQSAMFWRRELLLVSSR